MMSAFPIFCEHCAEEGVTTFADFVTQPVEVSGRHLVCGKHFALLPADTRLNYVPAWTYFRQLEEGQISPR